MQLNRNVTRLPAVALVLRHEPQVVLFDAADAFLRSSTPHLALSRQPHPRSLVVQGICKPCSRHAALTQGRSLGVFHCQYQPDKNAALSALPSTGGSGRTSVPQLLLHVWL